LFTMTDPNGGVVTNQYDGAGRVVAQTDPMSRTTTFGYTTNADGSQTTTIVDPNGNVTVEQYQNNEMVALTKASGTSQAATWTYPYDPVSLGVASVTDPDGHVTSQTWDSWGDLLSSTDGANRTTTYTYDLNTHDLLSATDPAGVTTNYAYDGGGNLLTVTR